MPKNVAERGSPRQFRPWASKAPLRERDRGFRFRWRLELQEPTSQVPNIRSFPS
jgi:hypothetical protein